MAAERACSVFTTLCRTFLRQFFAVESAVSDEQLQHAMAGIVAFLIAPALLIPVQMTWAFEFAAIRFPGMLEPLTRLLATIFITYAMVAIGVIAAVLWDDLAFDRRDAMVLGPLPLRGGTVIAAKLTAMGALLLATAAVVNVITAVPFAMAAGNHGTAGGVLRHFAAHMIATIAAATFAYAVLVAIRAIVGMIAGRSLAVGSIVRFALFSALLCFVVFVPTTLHVVPGPRRTATVHMMAIPAWSPTRWFLGLYEWARGGTGAEWPREAARAIELTAAAVAAAVATTIAGYRRQLRLALTPSANAADRNLMRAPQALAARLAGRNRVARATSDFVLATIARTSGPQATIAMNGAIGMTIVVAGLTRAGGDIAQLARPRTIVLWIPLVLTYWVGIGLRAAFFVPGDPVAAWIFRVAAPPRSTAYWSGVRAATIAVVLPFALATNALLVPLIGVGAALLYAPIAASIALLVAETIALTLDFVPCTRPYPPGHARLKTRWPLYIVGLLGCALAPARFIAHSATTPASVASAALVIVAATVVVHLIGRRSAARWSVDPEVPPDEELSKIAVLDIGMAVHGAVQP